MADTPQIDKRLVRDLAKILNENGLTEVEVENDDLRIRLSRSMPVSGAMMMAPPPAAMPPAAAPAASAGSAGAPAEVAVDLANAVTSPMVGTAYHAPGPDEPPFVKPGDTVKAGQTLIIIEAMKTMNQIPAPKAGVVTQILVDDGQPVEYGEPLVIIE